MDVIGARLYAAEVGQGFLSVDPMAEDYPSISGYAYVLGNPINLIDPDGREPEPPKTILVFYHGGPSGGGVSNAFSATYKQLGQNNGYTEDLYQFAAMTVRETGREVTGVIIAPGVFTWSGRMRGQKFVESVYNEGDQIIIYGYSYGGDNAVRLTEGLQKEGIPVNGLIIVDSSDGPMRGMTVDTSIPENVEETLNIYQTGASGGSFAVGPNSDNPNSSEASSSDGSLNSPGSRGFPHSAEGSNRVRNHNATGPGVTHGNVQQRASNYIFAFLNNRIHMYEVISDEN